MTISDVFTAWDKDRAAYGTADYLRCAAMSCIDSPNLTRAAYLDEAAARGYNRATASRCWSFVANQGN